MTKKREIIFVLAAAALVVLVAAGGIFWYWRQPPTDIVVATPNLTSARRAEIETELKTALEKVEAESKNADNLIAVGRLEQKLGFLSAAERWYKKALKINERDSFAYIDLGILYEQMGKYEEADKALRIATQINPYNEGGFQALIDLYFAHFPGQAEELKNIFRAASDYVGSPDIWARYAKFLEDRRDFRQSLIYWQEAARSRPDDKVLKEAVARVSKILGK